MATRLKPAITKVALVDDGANPDADFVFYKASTVGKGLMVNDLRERLSAAVRDKFATADDDWTYVDDIDLDESSAIYSQDDRFYRVGYSLDANDDVTLSGDSIEVERQVEYLPVGKASKPHKKEAGMADDIKKNLDEATARIAELEAERTALDELTNDDLAALKGFEIAKVDPQVEVLKGLPENVRKRLEDSEAKIAKMEADARVATFRKRAADEYAKVGDTDEIGDALAAIDSADVRAKVEKALAAANERIDLAKILTVAGKDGDAAVGDDPVAKVRAKVEEIRKADPDKSLADATAEALRADPALADEWQASTAK